MSTPGSDQSLFPVTRIAPDEHGTTFFQEGWIKLEDGGEIGLLSDPVSVDRAIFRSTGADYDYDWHPTPRRQFILLMSGAIEIEVGSGEKRTFSAGHTIFLEDTEPPGHRTRNVGEVPRFSVFLQTDAPVPFVPNE